MNIIIDLSLFCLFLFIVFLFHYYLASDIFAISPSFSRQEIIDSLNDWELDPQYEYTCRQLAGDKIQTTKQNFPPDISAVSYYSDGKTLNATVMLSDSLNSSIGGDKLYHMVIQPESVYEIEGGGRGIYADEIYKPTNQKEWIKWIYERYSNGPLRTIYKNVNYTDAFNEENNTVPFSLNLSDIGSPSRYQIGFSAQYGFNASGQYCNTVDDVGWYQIPLPEYSISVLPSSINLRPGEEKNVEVKISSNHLGESWVILYPEGIENLQVHPKQISLTIPPQGSSNSIIYYKAADNITQPLPIVRTATINATITVPTSTTYGGLYPVQSNTRTENITESFSNFTITLLSPLTEEERFVAFWESYGGFISLVGGGFAAGFAALVFNKLTRSKK